MSKVIIDGVEYVPKGAEVEAGEWPQDGDEAYLLTPAGSVEVFRWTNSPVDHWRQRQGSCFATRQKAEYERLRRECMATRWVPENGDDFFAYVPNQKSVSRMSYDSNFLAVCLGLAAPIREEAKARWDMYGDAWLDALDVTTKK